MDAIAWGANHTEKFHTLAKDTHFSNEKMADNGSIEIQLKTENISLKGNYFVKLTFTAAEIDKMYRLSVASTTKGLTERSEPKPTAEVRHLRRI